MFRVTIEQTSSKNSMKRVDNVMKTEKLYEVLGRFTLKYGPPILTEEMHGIYEAEFFKELGGETFEAASIVFARIAVDGKLKAVKGNHQGSFRRSTPPVINQPYTPPSPPEPNDERIDEMLNAGVLEKSYSYNR